MHLTEFFFSVISFESREVAKKGSTIGNNKEFCQIKMKI